MGALKLPYAENSEVENLSHLRVAYNFFDAENEQKRVLSSNPFSFIDPDGGWDLTTVTIYEDDPDRIRNERYFNGVEDRAVIDALRKVEENVSYSEYGEERYNGSLKEYQREYPQFREISQQETEKAC